MVKNKFDLFEEIKTFRDVGNNIYVGKLDEIKGDNFDTNNLCVATLFNFSVNLDSYKTSWNETSLKYVFEMVQMGEHTFYREIFSGVILELFDFNSLLKLRGMYLAEPMSYDEYVISFNCDSSLKRIRVLN